MQRQRSASPGNDGSYIFQRYAGVNFIHFDSKYIFDALDLRNLGMRTHVYEKTAAY